MRTNRQLHDCLRSPNVDLVRISVAFATLVRFSAVSAVAESALIEGGSQSVNAEPAAKLNMRVTPQHLAKHRNNFIKCNKVFMYIPTQVLVMKKSKILSI